MFVGSVRNRKTLGLSLLACFCAFSSVCWNCNPALPYTSPPGTLDARPVSAFGKSSHERMADFHKRWPGMPGRHLFDPAKGRPVPAFADEAIGGRIAEFVAYHEIHGHWSRFLYFYTAPTAGPGPGLCRSRAYSADGRSDDKDNSPGLRGEWRPDVYSVAGSVAPMARPWSADYAARLEVACAARRDMGYWFSASPGKAYAGARMADAIVASARKSGALGFTLRCRPFPQVSERPRCQGKVREVVASINPRAIRSVGECHDVSKSSCLSIALAQFPEQGDYREGELWTLSVHYRHAGELGIVAVVVGDTRIDFH